MEPRTPAEQRTYLRELIIAYAEARVEVHLANVRAIARRDDTIAIMAADKVCRIEFSIDEIIMEMCPD